MSDTEEPPPRPSWIREGLEGHFVDDDEPHRRNNTRHVWVRLALLESPVKILNVSADGIGLLTREPLTKGQCVKVTPEGVSADEAPYETATLRVVHSTPTLNGHKVGCVFV